MTDSEKIKFNRAIHAIRMKADRLIAEAEILKQTADELSKTLIITPAQRSVVDIKMQMDFKRRELNIKKR